MMRQFVCTSLVVTALMVVTFAQDATKLLPDAYKLELENDIVRVVRIRYAPGVNLPLHTHTGGTIYYIYLNDSDGIKWVHENGRVTPRPAVKMGSLRLSTGGEERHTGENLSTAPAEWLRIELKTIEKAARQRIPRPALDSSKSVIVVDHKSERLLIQRVWIAPGQSLTVEAVEMPALWVSLPSGETRWAEAGKAESITNTGSIPMEFVRTIISR
jgi:predicted metal-dependent enzyme (double-stranded beta helix superfamily)